MGIRENREEFVRAARFAINRRLVDSSALGVKYLGSRPNMRRLLPVPGSDLMIDGFPRSANSYLFHAVRISLPDVSLCGHTHSGAAVLRAASNGVPAFIALREPRACCASLVQYLGKYATLQESLRAYIRYFESFVDEIGPSVTYVSFESVTTSIDSVLVSVAGAIGAGPPQVVGDTLDIAVHEKLRERNLFYNKGSGRTIAGPTTYRRSANEVWSGSTAADQRLLAEAESLFGHIRNTYKVI